MKEQVILSMNRMQLPRIRFSIFTLILLTVFSAWFIRARVSPMLLSIKINPNGSFEHDGEALPATAIQGLLEKYHAKQKWYLSRSILKIAAPGSITRKPIVGDAIDYVALSACFIKFDQVRNEWYTESGSPGSSSAPDPDLSELVHKIRNVRAP